MLRHALCAALALQALLFASHSMAYPTRPVRLIVPYPPGGPTDLIGRAVNEGLGKRLGQQVVVDNRGGAASVVGAEIAARAPADGHTLLVATATTLAVNPALNDRLPYHPTRDFSPVCMLGATPYMLVVNPAVPATSVAQLITHLRANPGKLSFGSAGSGSSAHLAGEMFKHMAGLDIVHIPYKGSGPAMMDVIGGQVAMMFSSISALKPHIDARRMRPLAVSSAKRSASAPDIPTLDESGLKGYETKSWNAVVAPRGTPAKIVARINAELRAVLATPEVAGRAKTQGIELDPGTPEDLGRYIGLEMNRYGKLISAIGLKWDNAAQ
jgi:tripartite-type tricarboxylate transporter receptor subunit TctC